MSAGIELDRLEAILDASGGPAEIEDRLPTGVKARQLSVRTLMLGILITLADDRPAHLRRIHRSLICLPESQKRRLGVIASWKSGPHELTYRQTERTYGLINRTFSKQKPDGQPSQILSEAIDSLIEASVTVLGIPESSSYAIDWSDYESFARAPRKSRAGAQEDATEQPQGTTMSTESDAAAGRDADEDEREPCADTEAAWGHRKTNHPAKSEMFYGYYLQAATFVKEQDGPQIPELVRRITLCSCKEDPPEQIVPVICRMAKDGIEIGEMILDSGYSYRRPQAFAAPIRALGAQLVMDLHPNDRGIKGTHQGAVIANGNLYCPATPRALLELGPAAPGATQEELAAHDQKTAELSRYKLSPLTAPDSDGYKRIICPAVKGKLRCPHKPASITLSHERPTILSPPEHPPLCCTQHTITVPPSVNAKTAQKHDYPSAAHRHSYARRTAAERSFSRLYDPAGTDISRGWSRLMGLTPNTIMLACATIILNLRTADAFTARQAEDRRRAEHGLVPKRRRRRRRRRRRQQTAHKPTRANAHAPPTIAV